MIEPRAFRPKPITLGADKAYDVQDFVNEFRSMNAASRRAERQWPLVGDRRLHDATRGLCGQPTHPQADRGGLRLDQDGRRSGANQVPRPRARRMGLHLRHRRLQSGAVAKALRGFGVKAPANCRLIGRWRIVESDLS
jgi:hypothetical protein